MKLKIMFLIFFILIIFTNNLPSKEYITISTGEWPPYISKNLKFNGVVSRIISDAFKLENIKVDYKFFPWKRAYILAQKGIYHASSIWVKNKKREKDFLYSDNNVLNIKTVLFHKKSFNFHWSNIADLKKYRTGATLGYSYGKEFDKYIKENRKHIFWAPDDLSSFKNLYNSRIDVFPSDYNVGISILINNFNKNQVDLFTYHKQPLASDKLFLLFPKETAERSQRLKKIFNRGLNRLKKSGEFKLYYKQLRQGFYNK